MSAAAAVAAPEPTPEPVEVVPEQKTERDVIIVDVQGGDAKVIEYTKSFNVTWRDPETGKTLYGTFSAKRPTIGQLGQIAVIKAKLNGGMQLHPSDDFLHEMIASLQVILTTTPDWWTPNDFFSATPLQMVWDHVRSWIDSFRSRRVG